MADKVDYAEQLKQLESGAIDKIEVQPANFMDFQTAYMNFDRRKRVIGTANQGGMVTYVFEHDEADKKTE
ncbi:hypothetical protein [Lentilactobacillus kisonensis]|uniref:Uncharacterized protein n=2 Tax=Lentilactobacillus kisonensis TaxID=481722 RepID=H1LGP4_9LACO|nr:hypothetical protein [Lentilactobacillus kisonensis]EHO50863.1 hypothetical protein HMPREF9104_01772 [Lentilactobacillus kisonensis F0435]KRL20571.1 hypothetical protein FC98_GL001351 [Lentilactobacillus kisonensis DSM 19906 = JCM 15041]